MKRVIIGLVVCVLGGSMAWGGYRNVDGELERGGDGMGVRRAEAPVASRVVAREEWRGGMVLGDGEEVALANNGGKFVAVRLPAGAKAKVWVAGPGLPAGREVVLTARCGGLLDGKVRANVVVDADGVLRFSYENGGFGAEPILATVQGQTETLLVVHAIREAATAAEGGAL